MEVRQGFLGFGVRVGWDCGGVRVWIRESEVGKGKAG